MSVNLTCGVPQGTLLGPMIFLALINDAMQDSPCKTWKYVDDLYIGQIVKKDEISSIQNDVALLNVWSNENKQKLNPTKCKTMYFNFQYEHEPLLIGNATIEIVNETKLLGLWIQANLKWDRNVKEIVSKASRRLHILCRLRKFNLPKFDLVDVFKSYIRPSVEYAVP
ncbi:uncharacterized protein [Antedon mediterranea]|uniref:uncharacterized protein n=1 Tax=Antedon mediterranea TaxID=105859 RepID=UPI003AF898FF